MPKLFFDSAGKLRLRSFSSKLLVLALVAVPFPLAAAVSITYEVIARTGVTTVPGTTSKFVGLGDAPAIDKQGNVVFSGGSSVRAGVYTAIGGVCCQAVADTTTAIPGQGGSFVFSTMYRHDIDAGRVAFKARDSANRIGLYSNAGQATATTLKEVALIDGVEWSGLGDPWVDGTMVAIYGNRLIPSAHNAILLWNGATGGKSFVNPGTGYSVSLNSQASISSGAAILSRSKTGANEIGIAEGSQFETLAIANVTQMPGLSGVKFTKFYAYPGVDRGGNDALFLGYGTQMQGLYKRVNGGTLQKVADTTTPVPGTPSDVFGIFTEAAIALANGQVLFVGQGQYSRKGIYTDVGGALAVLVDNDANKTITVGGQSLTLAGFNLGSRGFAYTPQGYRAVFRIDFAMGGSAIIRATINAGSGTIAPNTFTVRKDFSNNSTASVSVTLTCTSGTVTNNPRLASESAPAVFTISGATAGTTCKATEPTVPAGYTRNQTDCQNGDPLNGSCTIVNTLNTTSSNTFTVYKNFSNNSTASVSVTLTCTSGTVTNSPRLAREGQPAVFTISGATAGTTCKATEPTVPAGYTRNQTDCQNGDPLNGSCTIVNTLNTTSSNTFTVYKNFSNNSTASVSVTLTCTSGTVTNSPRLAREGQPAVFTISGAAAGTTCKATEPTVPSGYTRNQTDCQNGDPLNGSCTIINTLNTTSSNTFTVRKDFSNNNPASVSVTLSCTSGTVTNSPRLASEGAPAVFSISGATAGTTCKATEPTVPSGYSRNQTDCQNGDPLNGSCTIINTAIPVTILNSNFETGTSTGWATSGDVVINSAVAVGQYALRLSNNGASATRTVSTAGYTAVSVTMKLAAQSLESNDSCFAEISTNGGSTWTGVLSLSSSNPNGSFYSGTVSPAAASNNSSLRLRARMAGNGNGDYCWLDDVKVVGTASSSTTQSGESSLQALSSSSTTQSSESSLQALSLSVTEPDASTFAVGTMSDEGPAVSGFDPGFDQLVGSGEIIRSQLGYDELIGGSDLSSPPGLDAFGIPAGAGQPLAYFSGTLELRGGPGVGQSDIDISASSLQSLPEFSFDFVQVGNHLFPVGSSVAATGSSGFDYVIDTGRVWREASDNGFSRATIPFMLMQMDSDCVYNGRLTFLFQDDGTTSRAAYQITGSACDEAPEFTLWGSADAMYTPGTKGLGATEIGTVLGCAEQNWLPFTIGDGGMTMVLTPDGMSHYVLRDAETSLWIDAADTGNAVDALCR